MSKYSIALIPGDGIGQDVTREAVKVLNAVAPAGTFTTTEYDLGAARWLSTNEALPDSVLAELKNYDAILLGAVGDPRVPPGPLERGLLLRLRFELDHYVNLRPVKLYPGVVGPLAGKTDKDIDMVVVREGTEGAYVGSGGVMRKGTIHEVATEESLNTAFGAERVIRDAFKRAQKRKKHLTLVHKANVLVNSGDMWRRTLARVNEEFSDVETAYQHIDAASMFFVTNPEKFDVVVTDNLFGDILTDIGAAIAGGIGLAASGNINPDRTHPSMFEPVHGSAPDIAGKNIADPTAAILSVSMMLEHLGEGESARKIEQAVAADLLARKDTKRSTTEIGDALAGAVS
jgi:3-isopropylmalate dehydrogenase